LFGATGIFGSYIEIFTTTSTIYKGENFSSAPNIQGANFGTFTTGATLLLGNAQVNTFKNIGAGDNVTGAELQYRVYPTVGSPGAFSIHSFSFQANSTYTDLGGMTVTGGGDQAWGNTNDINLMALTSGNGNYTLEVFFKAFTNLGDRFSSNGGNNFKANFTVVPEPSAALLGALGLLGLLRRRRN
jgi:MYXO-CTERM domain-containing protein